ncbi:MAG TPA: 50S ribosomal protein L19e [candidate division Zixibacteria bacterium]|nr:50S ribosomal protein L19e [candidate division Zixibacteria bacterium]
MTDLKTQRNIAADILGVGVNRIYIDPDAADEVQMALTRRDIRALIHSGAIRARKIEGISRARARELHLKRIKGQRRGQGSRKGRKAARTDQRREWINRIRKQRAYLKVLRDKSYIDKATYRILYSRAKGGMFRSANYLRMYIQDNRMSKKKLPEVETVMRDLRLAKSEQEVRST